MFHTLSSALESLDKPSDSKHLQGTGYVDALEALSACTEDVAAVQPDSPFVDDKIIKYFIWEIIG